MINLTYDELTVLGKLLAKILRHTPSRIGINLDEHGWANVNDLLKGINHSTTHYINRDILNEIVETDEKQRYSFSPNKKLIRANQGHSIPVDVELKEFDPPTVLYHGTTDVALASINSNGIQKRSRLYVHLTDDIITAIKSGKRHSQGKCVVLYINAKKMKENGYKFFQSVNGVWLTEYVPPEYIILQSNPGETDVVRFVGEDAYYKDTLVATISDFEEDVDIP